MGQRLVISVNRDLKRIATVYYHWSGYTVSALEEVLHLANIYNSHYEIMENLNNDEFVIQLAAYIHGDGGFSEESKKYLEKKLSRNDLRLVKSRNDGIFDVTEEGMADSDGWAEAFASIDFTRKVFSIEGSVLFFHESEYDEIYEFEDDFDPDNLPEIDTLSEIPFVEMESLLKKLQEIGGVFRIKDDAEGIYMLIE